MNEISKLYQTIIFNPRVSDATLIELQLLVLSRFLKTKFKDNRSISQLRQLIYDELQV